MTLTSVLSKTSSALRSVLPIEIVDTILRTLTRPELVECMCVNSVFHDVSTRILYHTIDDLRPRKSVECLLQLLRTANVQPLVRCLHLDWSEKASPTVNLYRLLHRLLQRLPSLTSLSLELPRHHSPLWVLRNCPFHLKYFSTSMPSKQDLADFLDTQPSITELTLRGFNHEDHLIPPFLATAASSFAQARFSLHPTSLPRLISLRTVHGGPSVISSVVSGRPVQMASVALFPTLASETLKALERSTVPMKRLSIMSFDPFASDYLLGEIAERFPALEALHIVILLSEYTTALLKSSGPLLARFKSLQYITFMAATDEASSTEEEQGIAKLWHHWCPTLKTIILPKGKVWFGGAGNTEHWSTLDEALE